MSKNVEWARPKVARAAEALATRRLALTGRGAAVLRRVERARREKERTSVEVAMMRRADAEENGN